MNTIDAMKQALDALEDWHGLGTSLDCAEQSLREAIAHEEARGVKPATDRSVLVQNLREHHIRQGIETLAQAADMLEQDGIDLDYLPDELTVAYMQGHSRGVEVGKKQAQHVSAPQDRPCKIGGTCVVSNTSPCACRNAAAPQPPQGEK